MKILVAGDWHSKIHEEPVFNAFVRLGHKVEKFSWFQYFRFDDLPPLLKQMGRFIGRAQNKFIWGSLIDRINRDFLKKVLSFKPDMIFIYRGTHIKSATLRRIKAEMPETRIAGYNNDDPFSGKHPYSLWKHFLRCLPDYDIVFAYRRRNLEDFRTNGAKRVALLRSWFVPEYNYPVPLTAGELGDFSSDVVFIGHFERDGRLECLEELAGLNIKLRLYGHPEEWNHRLVKSPNLRRFAPVHTVWGEDYNRAICGSKIALCFLSKLNRDTYTRRCFEIPASGSLLLSEHSEDLESLFQRGIEADFFSNKKELIERIQYYLLHEEKRKKVARAGRECVVKNGHDVVSRMRYVLETLFQNSRS